MITFRNHGFREKLMQKNMPVIMSPSSFSRCVSGIEIAGRQDRTVLRSLSIYVFPRGSFFLLRSQRGRYVVCGESSRRGSVLRLSRQTHGWTGIFSGVIVRDIIRVTGFALFHAPTGLHSHNNDGSRLSWRNTHTGAPMMISLGNFLSAREIARYMN